MYRILIVDDHPVLAEGLKSLVEEYKLSSITEIAGSGAECLKKLSSREYDLMLLDINLPDANGIDLCRSIMAEYPGLRILALTSFSEFACVHKMMANGARGYILKNSMPEEIIKGVETVMNGDIFLCHEVDVLLSKEPEKHVFLTQRETELLRLIVEGYTNIEIADKLFLGAETIKSYRKNLIFKLNVKNTASLVKKAIQEKLV